MSDDDRDPCQRLRKRVSALARSREQIEHFFDGFELLDPGLVAVQQWRAHADAQEINRLPTVIPGGVGRVT